MWTRYVRPHEGDPLDRDDWFVMRTEEATDGRVTLVLVDFAAGARPTLERSLMALAEARALCEEIAAELEGEGWKMDAPPNLYRPW